MIDPLLPYRLAASASQMMCQQAVAMTGLWGQLAAGNAGTWGASAWPLHPSLRTVRSWYRQPDTMADPVALMRVWMPAASPTMQPAPFLVWATAPGGAQNAAMLLAAWQPWLRLWAQQTPMQAWPTALMLMAIGMPSAAAWPTAEAQAHAMAASAKAAEGLGQMFASYRSDGGHALAQIVRPSRLH
jgi:hypothetical protein